MKYELDLFGVIVPSLLLWSVLAYVLARIVSKLVVRAGLCRDLACRTVRFRRFIVCLVASLAFTSKEFFS